MLVSPTNPTNVDVISVHSLVVPKILLACKDLPTGGIGRDGGPIVEILVEVTMIFASEPPLTDGT